MALAPFPVNAALTGIAIAYRNPDGIADSVFPRVQVASQLFSYTKFTKSDAFTLPDTKVGRKSAVNEVEFGGTQEESSTEDHALESPIPNADIENAQATSGAFDPEGQASEMLAGLLALGRERRVASMVFDDANYAAGNQTDLAALDQWDESGGDPLGDIQIAMDGMMVRPNIAVMSSRVFSVLRKHSALVAAAFPVGGNAADGGQIDRATLANLLELDEVLVGRGWLNSAAPGQTASYDRIWGNHLALLVRARSIPNVGTLTFGLTAQWGGKVAARYFDERIGMRGGMRVRVGESLRELVVANDLGYLFENVVSEGVVGS